MVILGSFSALFCENLAVTREWLVIERHARKFGVVGVCVIHMGTFDLEHVKVNSGSLRALFSEWLIVERTRRKSGPLGVSDIMGIFDLEHVWVIRCTYWKIVLFNQVP